MDKLIGLFKYSSVLHHARPSDNHTPHESDPVTMFSEKRFPSIRAVIILDALFNKLNQSAIHGAGKREAKSPDL